ncbi:MAG: hypothetical protein ACYSTS_16455 [Planctomycetota bacterium]
MPGTGACGNVLLQRNTLANPGPDRLPAGRQGRAGIAPGQADIKHNTVHCL